MRLSLTTLPSVEWRHVRSEDNPADCATRGFLHDQMLQGTSSLWWEGPAWVMENWENIVADLQTGESNLYDVQAHVKRGLSRHESSPLEYLLRFSSFSKINLIKAWIYRWKFNAVKNYRGVD